MNSDAAFSLATDWVRSHGDDQVVAQECEHTLEAELIGLVPEPATVSVAVAEEEEVPVIVALDGAVMLTIAVRRDKHPGGETTSHFTCTARSLWAGGSLVTLRDAVYDTGSLIERHRTWQFQLPDDYSFEIFGSETVRGGFSGDRQPDKNELSARAMARALGWRLPDDDESPAEYQ